MFRAIKRFFITPRRRIQLGSICGFTTMRVSETDWLEEVWQEAEEREDTLEWFRDEGYNGPETKLYMRNRPPVLLTIDKHGFQQLVF